MGLVGHPSSSVADSGAEGDLNCGGPALETILVYFCEDQGYFLLLSRNMPEARLKSFGLIALAEDIPNNLALTVLCDYQ